MTSPFLIELENVRRVFDDSDTSGVRNASLRVARGEYIAIVGPSGAGKTTLLNVLGLLDRPQSGTYRFSGIDVGTLSERARDRMRSTLIGFVFQSAFVLGDESAYRNAALGLRVQGDSMDHRAEASWSALRELGLESRWEVPARLLSGGERQRLAIARAIATQPTLILADEPTGNLDSANGHRVIEHLERLNAAGATVIVITHDERVADRARRRVVIMDGRLREEASSPSRHIVRNDFGAPTTEEPFWQGLPKLAGHGWASRLADDLADAWGSISRRLFRSALLALAFILGVGGLVTASGLSESASAQVSDRLTAAALDEVRIYVPGGSELLNRGDGRLDMWIQRLQALPHVVEVGFVASVPASHAGLGRLGPSNPMPSDDIQVIVASSGYLQLAGVESALGADVTLVDNESIGDVAWAGEGAATSLALAPPGPGSTVWVTGRRVEIAGFFLTGARAPNLERAIVVSPAVLRGVPQVTVAIVIRTELGFPAVVADAAPVALDPINPGRFGVETVADLRSLRFGVANDLGSMVALLSAMLLVLAAISASTTMYVSVQARAYEVAFRRAIGSSRFDVARLFLAEGAIVGTIGGSAGALLGVAGAQMGARVQGWTPVLSIELVPLSLLVGIVSGLASAAVPAWIASRQEPATAIRS